MKIRILVPASALLFIIVGGGVALADLRMAHWVWMAGLLLGGPPIVFRTARAALRGRFATDVVASLSILGAVLLDQPLAGLVIVLMQSGGEALERYAEGRASAALRALEAAAPRTAHRVVDDRVDEVAATDVCVGDILLIRPGDLIPCDGLVVDGSSEVDTSSITGEPLPLNVTAGSTVMSGCLNGFQPFRIRATALAANSQYARIVDLVRTAQATKAPIQRLADRYAVWFTPLTLVVCALAVIFTHDWNRALAVLVIATPCPLILAAPVAIVGGINRAARRHIVVRHGGALEQLGNVDIAVFDKTGTITLGMPRLSRIQLASGFSRANVLRMAAAMEQGSSHLLARVLVSTAEAEGVSVPRGVGASEAPGQGVAGEIDGHSVRIGARSFVLPFCESGVNDADRLEVEDAALRAYFSVDGRLAAVFEYEDEIRPELASVLARLRERGIRRFVLLSGDHAPVARSVAARAGISETYGDLMPADKATFIERLRAEGTGVMMVGDGVNDAPALTEADVGVALAYHGRGGGITTEAADVILLSDSLAPLADAIDIGRRTLRIARQSIIAGLALSGVGMLVAAFGALPPVAGAGIQEVIDIAVILNALRSARDVSTGRGPRPNAATTQAERRTNASTRNIRGVPAFRP